MLARRSSAIPAARPLTIRRSVPPCSATYIVPAEPRAAFRNAIATGLDNPVTTGSSRRCTDARSRVVIGTGRVLDVAAGLVVVMVGATEVGAVEGAACGELLLHAPSASAAPATATTTSLRTETSVGRGAAYDPSPLARIAEVAVRYVVFVPDGCADVALDELDGRTPLEAARMPRLADLAARSDVGRAEVIPPGFPPGSDVGNMAILGFDPARYHTGRAPIEAAAMGVELGPDEVAYRCNLVTVSDAEPPVMVDFAAGHLTSGQSHPIVAAL